jgi:hypothetical protein
MAAPLLPHLQVFGAALTKNFATAGANPAQAEDQLKLSIAPLLEAAGNALGYDVGARTEAHAEGVRPDVGVTVGKLLTGHIELKAPGKGARPKSFSEKHDKEQFKKLSDHPNLIYTDGNEWMLYREGKPVGALVKSVADVTTAGAGAYDENGAIRLEMLLRDFFGWQPMVPSSPRALAAVLAPLTRLLREAVAVALDDPASNLTKLADEWRSIFFPDADNARFADAYAQTVTYALLLARVEGETDLRNHAADRLDARHDLLAQVLRVLAQPAARKEVEVPVELLERSVEAVDPTKLLKRAGTRDVWLYFYEDFLAAYDPQLRKQSGVYYTPAQVVGAQVRLVAELLRERFDLELGFAEPDVVVLDPAVGTGTYLLAALDEGAEAARVALGEAGAAERAGTMARNFYGFELLVGPYAVAQLRLAQGVLRLNGDIPEDGLNIILSDTLESPYAAPPHVANAPLFEQRLAKENMRARKVKLETSVIVCLGNPPYFRQVIDPSEEEDVARQGGWVRFGDEPDRRKTIGILSDFVKDTPGVHVKNLYNLYVYFWRWALWKVFETGDRRGVVTFISASSYLRGPGFAGMRKYMRERFDELWILDLGGEGRGARPDENVFAIRTPVAIAIGYRAENADATLPAQVRYARIDGTRMEKLDSLEGITTLDDVNWEDCLDGWTDPLVPKTAGDYYAWPALTGIFPWQHSGLQFKRTWPIAPDAKTLETRWAALTNANDAQKPALFRESRDRKVGREFAAGEALPRILRFAYRSFDRQYILADFRVGDFLRPVLWKTLSDRQLFLTSTFNETLGAGPACAVTQLLPDMHYFNGRGAKDVVPLWRDAACAQPNIPDGLLDALEQRVGSPVTPEDLFGYCYAVLAAPSYTSRFAQELETPGPRVPLTLDSELFQRAAELGANLIWLHTYAERFVPPGMRAGRIPKGAATYVTPIPQTTAGYPEHHSYDPEKQELHVGDGVFAPVAPCVRGYSVSGLDVIGSWLDYRMKKGAGRRSSDLDKIRPEIWPEAFTQELLELVWVIEQTVALGPDLDATLDTIVAGPTIPATMLPQPTDAERKAPD